MSDQALEDTVSDAEQALKLKDAFLAICDFCAWHAERRARNEPALVKDEDEAIEVRGHLEALQREIAAVFPVHDGIPLRVKVSQGSTNFPHVPWLCILPPDQEVNDGIYVAMCFGKEGAGAIVGCAQSVSKPKGLQVFPRSKSKPLPIDVDGASAGTHYNDAFENPLEIYRDTFDPEQLLQHIRTSLDHCIRHLYPTIVTPPASPNSTVETDIEPPLAMPTLDELATATNLSRAELQAIEALLEERRQLIFEGPPGSGKTFVADKFARYFTGSPLEGPPDERLVLAQFHQSYGYEDFVQGIRPETNDKGQLEYHVRDGVFKRLCSVATANKDKKFVIVIDEINRGNLSRIFGELLLLLEYRDKHAVLPYARPDDPPFAIPGNVYLIGTMNTADRSLAQIDYALRRRFYFYRLLPVVDGRAPVLERWLRRQGYSQGELDDVLPLFIALNQQVQKHLEEDFQVGHSYFMVRDIVKADRQVQLWQRAILPLLGEYFYNRRDRKTILASLSHDNLRQQARTGTPAGG